MSTRENIRLIARTPLNIELLTLKASITTKTVCFRRLLSSSAKLFKEPL